MNKPTKILITEDEMIVALDLERRLKKLGFDCSLASSGEQAIALAAEYKPDIALMDICLQGEMDGVTAASRIQIQNEIPIIYLTANADEHTLKRAEITHPASYLLKPFKERELQICIEMALINHALQQELRKARAEMEKKVIERTTELLRTNEILRKEIISHQDSEAQVREQAALLDKSRDAIYVRNIEGQILYWNLSAERLYGFSKIDAIGQSISGILHINAATEATALERAQHHGEWMGEFIHHHRSGAERIVESRWMFMPDKAAILVVETDISEKKKMEAQFLRVQRLESVGALASGIAHDLNNVFTPLIMTAQLLCEDPPNEKIKHLANIIMTSSYQGSDMVKQVLLFVRGTEGGNETFRLEHLINDIVSLLRETFPKNIRLRSSYAADLWPVVGDATRLHQVLMNLCINARDAMPQGGDLKLKLSNFHVDEAFARQHSEAKPGKYIHLDVTDTGTGMSTEVRAKIFEPFFTTKAPGKGTGLGLATIQNIVRGHDGFLVLESELGVGTTFRVFLPAGDPNKSSPVELTKEIPMGKNELILLADDEHSIREIVKATLDACGYQTVLADNGIEAIEKFTLQKNEFHCLIADLDMPRLAGLPCARAIRDLAPDLPILLISGTNDDDVPLNEIKSIGASYLSKPFSKTNLLKSLQECLAPLRSKTKPASQAHQPRHTRFQKKSATGEGGASKETKT